MLRQLSCVGAGHGCVLYLQSPNSCCLYEGKKNFIPVDNNKFLDLSHLLENSLVLVQPKCLTARVRILPCAGTGSGPWIHLWDLGRVTFLPSAAVTPPVHLLRVSVSLEHTPGDSLGCDVGKEITFME